MGCVVDAPHLRGDAVIFVTHYEVHRAIARAVLTDERHVVMQCHLITCMEGGVYFLAERIDVMRLIWQQ